MLMEMHPPPAGCLEDLPELLLQKWIFSRLDAFDLARLTCCSTAMLRAATCDDLWRFLFHAHFNISIAFRRYYKPVSCFLPEPAPPPPPFLSWYRAFSFQQSIRCIECKEHTPYVFTLLPSAVRLCERCEQSHSKYALVTELEARNAYLLDDDDLKKLSFKEIKIRKVSLYFFLRKAVEEAAIQKQAKMEAKPIFEMSKEMKLDNNSSTINEVSSKELNLENNSFVINEVSKDASESNEKERNEQDVLGRNEKKLVRKKHKEQVKAENRQRRMAKSLGRELKSKDSTSSGNPLLSSSEMMNHAEASVTDSYRARLKHRSKREHVSTSSVGAYRGDIFDGYVSRLKQKSPSVWIKEREWLEAELGQNGISALVLA